MAGANRTSQLTALAPCGRGRSAARAAPARLALRVREVHQAPLNAFKNKIEILNHLDIPVTHHTESLALEKSCARCISCNIRSDRMLTAIEFDNELLLEANRVNNIWSDRLLASEF